jgi:hypothetical protein
MYLQEALTAFSVGLLTSFSPCVPPLYPGFLAYPSGGQWMTNALGLGFGLPLLILSFLAGGMQRQLTQ